MSTSAPSNSLRISHHPIRSIPVSRVRALYEVFAACHDAPSLDAFVRELGRKSSVILISGAADGRIVGFVTQTVTRIQVDGQALICVLNDDAVVLPAWRAAADAYAMADVGHATRWTLTKLKLRHPMTPVYWCQLARHVRSYLLMADHARQPFPGAGTHESAQRRIAQRLGKALLGDDFDSRKMLLHKHGQEGAHPHAQDAGTTGMRPDDPRMALFQKWNPYWRRGSALLCVSAFDLPSMAAALQSGSWQWFRRRVLRNYPPHLAGSTSTARATSQQQASWQDSSLDEALERGETS